MFVDTVMANTLTAWLGLLLPESRIFGLYLLSTLLLAFIAYWHAARSCVATDDDMAASGDGRRRWSLSGFVAHVFDRRVFLHPSARQDYKIFLINGLVYYGVAVQFLISVPVFSALVHTGLVALLGPPGEPVLSGLWAKLGYTVSAIVLFDLTVFLMHTAAHRVPLLWHFHAVHHSAEALTPISLFRHHPVDLFLMALATSAASGVAYAGFFYLTLAEPQAYTVLGVNIILFLFYIGGYNLRHSHVWLSYPVWLSNILISPAQHQIHHSTDPRHWNRNMGLIFAFWDRLAGSLYVPRGFEKLSFGLRAEEPNPFASLRDIYVKPFDWAMITAREWLAGRERRAVACSGAAAAFAMYAWMFAAGSTAVVPWSKPEIRLAHLTWIETHQAVAKGYDAVIVPTGGTEQNGPFVALGKHNAIVAETAHIIARRAGRTLVAPVMAYVPEGEFEPQRTGHMRYAGTLSLPEPVFEAVLEATARSLKAHGFKWIFLLGDSGDSQASQQKVAVRLDAAWRAEGVRVVQLDDYYFANDQKETLLRRGLSAAEIGSHAGMRDMSELMAVAPDMVRVRRFQLPAGYPDHGANGRFDKASASIGREMLELKIKAGARAIDRARMPTGPLVGNNGS